MGLMSLLRSLSPLAMGASSWGSDLVTLSSPTLDEATANLLRPGGSSSTRTYRLPTVDEALGVPAIHRAVALIASTTGMLSVQGYQNGALMDSPPRLIVRPDPYSTPYSFYAGTAAQLAKWGEFVWWIAHRDTDGNPDSLQVVPVRELTVQATTNRLRSRYTWRSIDGANIEGGRWTPATPDGKFVHVMYPLCEPYDLRGQGPLQLCKGAASVSVEAQAWAAQFFAEGGGPSTVIKHAGLLSPDEDADGLNEADRLRADFVNRPHNVPRVIDQNIESISYMQPNQQGAQMLEARSHQKGDAAEMFGIPGSLLEYQQPGSSLTYQNLEGEFTKLVKVCLQPLYLEPIEQALSDLLPRTTVARFNVKGFLRADIKTRFEVYGIAIDKGIYGPDYAQREEGILPGDVEFSPVPYSPPQAIPTRIASLAGSEVRCNGSHPKGGVCGKLLAEHGPFVGTCPRCRKVHSGAA